MAEPLAVVYYVRRGDRNEELRYSLRSLVNLPHGPVWIVGYKPSWVRGVQYVEGNRGRSAEHSAVDNLRLACEHLEADRFVVMNDDFYIRQPVQAVPSLHAGLLEERISAAATGYGRQLRAAAALLSDRGFKHPLAWTLHIPLVVVRETLAGVLSLVGIRSPIPEWRTVYGNVARVPGYPADDVKVRRASDPMPAGPFLSTQDGSFPAVLPHLRRLFPGPSEYEA